MDLTLLRSLTAVSELGSVTDAARSLGISQSALSRRLSQLEAELSAPLLERVGRGVVLTELGDMVVEEGQLLVQRYEQLKSRLRAHLNLDAGVVRIGGGATFVGYMLPRAIATFQKQHPGILFRLKEAGSREVENAVVRDELELGVVTMPISGDDVTARPLVKDKIVLVASEHHALAQKGRVHLEQLQHQSVVGFEAGTAVRRLIDGVLRDANAEVNVVMELRSVAAILQMVETTNSLAFVSELAVRGGGLRRHPGVVPLKVRGLNIQRELALISRKGRSLSTAAGAFVEVLTQLE